MQSFVLDKASAMQLDAASPNNYFYSLVDCFVRSCAVIVYNQQTAENSAGCPFLRSEAVRGTARGRKTGKARQCKTGRDSMSRPVLYHLKILSFCIAVPVPLSAV